MCCATGSSVPVWAARAVAGAGLLLLAACAGVPPAHLELDTIPPLELADRTVEPREVDLRVPDADLLAVSDDMRAFVRRYAGRLPRDRQRVQMLHWAIKSPGSLGLTYDPHAEGGAADTFHRGTANCLSFASLFVALAREAGLDARYQWLEVRPEWSRLGERLAVRLHVNALVEAEGGEVFQVDIDPLTSGEIAGSRRLTDREAEALYHSNLAMIALADEQLEEAWLQMLRALQRSSRMAHLWVNLGAIYRQAGQYDAAEDSYHRALALEPDNRSAMTNLMVLYQHQGRTEERDHWAAEVSRQRARNPYFHAWLSERAAEEQDWPRALAHIERAVELSRGDSHLLYSAGVMHYGRGNLPEAREYIRRAIESASLFNEREDYRVTLRAIEREQAEGG